MTCRAANAQSRNRFSLASKRSKYPVIIDSRRSRHSSIHSSSYVASKLRTHITSSAQVVTAGGLTELEKCSRHKRLGSALSNPSSVNNTTRCRNRSSTILPQKHVFLLLIRSRTPMVLLDLPSAATNKLAVS